MSNLSHLQRLSEILRQPLPTEALSAELGPMLSNNSDAEILQKIEVELEKNPNSIVLKSLWIKYSLRRDSIPISVFIGPVSSLLRESKPGSKAEELYVLQCSLEYLDRLLGRENNPLVGEVVEALSERLARGDTGLDLLLSEEIGKILNPDLKTQSPSSSQANIESINPASQLDDIRTPESIKLKSDVPSSGLQSDFLASSIASNKENTDRWSLLRKIKIPIVVTLAAVISVLGTRAFLDSFLSTPPSSYHAPFHLVSRLSPMVSPLVVSNIDLDRDHSKRLDTVNERVKGLEIAKSEQENIAIAAATTTSTLSGLSQSETIDLEPIASPEKAPPPVARKLPDVSATKPIEVSNLDAPERTPRIQDLKVGSDGKLYGPPTNRDPYQVEGGVEPLKTIDGKPVKSYPVNNFQTPRRYKTIGLTRVLSAPSMISTEVARLKPNAKIMVVSSMGPWLELRSKNGNRGYVYAQDTVPDE